MYVEFDKQRQGHLLILNKGEEFEKKCFVCGKDVEVPFFICDTSKQSFHPECEKKMKCVVKIGENHFHLKIVDVVEK